MIIVRKLAAPLGLVLMSLVLLVGAPAAQAAGKATVSVLHALPDATYDIYANGELLLEGLKPGTLTYPQVIPAGSYDLTIVKAGDSPDGKAVVEAKNTKVPAGTNITVVAHLDADGNPVITPYVNDVSMVPAGKARLVARHVAAAPAVDVRTGGTVVIAGLTNPNEDSDEVDAGPVKADLVLAGTHTVVIGPASLKLGEGTVTIVYAWGSADDKNLALAVQTISGMDSPPGGVPGGTGGQAAQSNPTWQWVALLLVALLGMALSATRLAARRASAPSR